MGDRTIRVFVSATFSDMQSERDALTRRVVPDLRERCKQLCGANLVDIDLRWGVPADTSPEKTIEICLSELEVKSVFLYYYE